MLITFAEVTLPESITDPVNAGKTAVAPPAAILPDKRAWKPTKLPFVESSAVGLPTAGPCQIEVSVEAAT